MLLAHWTTNLYDLEYAANGDNVSGLPPTQTELPFGSTVTLSSIAPGANFTVPASDTTLFAQWTLRRYTLRYLPGEHSVLSGDAEQSIVEGEDGSAVRADPQPDFVFVRWSDGVTDNPRIDLAVDANLEVTAECVGTATEMFSDGFE